MVRASSTVIVCCCLIYLVQHVAGGEENKKKCPTWCVSRADVPDEKIKVSVDWLCKNGANCDPIRPGGPCHVKNDYKAMASFALNDYFQKTKSAGGFCNYGNVATLSTSDPSHGACKFTCIPYK